MTAETIVAVADGTDRSGYSASLVPLRTLMVATQPPTAPIRFESVELECTCPDGWHAPLVTFAMA